MQWGCGCMIHREVTPESWTVNALSTFWGRFTVKISYAFFEGFMAVWGLVAHAGRGAAGATSASVTAAAHHVALGGVGLPSLAESVELVAEGKHEVAGEGVVAGVVNVVGGYRTAYVGTLLQEVESFKHDGGLTVTQELVCDGGIPHPFLLVVSLCVARGGGLGEVGGEHQSERCVP